MKKFPGSPTEYEIIVKDIYQTLLKKEGIEAKVRHNVRDICGISKTYPQLDVYWSFKVAGIEHRIVIDCKNYSKKVSIKDVRNLHQVINDIGATNGVIVTTIGYQTGAETFAREYNIDLKLVNTPEDIDWNNYIRAIKINITGIHSELFDFDIQCRVSHDKYLENLAKNRQLNISMISTEIQFFNADGSVKYLSLKDFLNAHISNASLNQIDANTHSYEIFPQEVYIHGGTVNEEKVFLPLIKLKAFYKTSVTKSSLRIDASSHIKAVLQDYTSGEIEYIHPK